MKSKQYENFLEHSHQDAKFQPNWMVSPVKRKIFEINKRQGGGNKFGSYLLSAETMAERYSVSTNLGLKQRDEI